MHRFMVLIILAVMLATTGCDDFGQVDQGRVIAYDKNEKTILMIRDKSPDAKKPDYTGLPPVSYKLPDDPHEMGPEPRVGKLMKIDLDKKEVVIFLERSNDVATVSYNLLEQKKVDPKDPLIIDPETKKMRKFPVIDQQNKTIELYVENKKTLVKFSVSDEQFALPPDSWALGDAVRIYYKEPGKSLRLMNVSKTDIFKK
jgi:hypothetical protein